MRVNLRMALASTIGATAVLFGGLAMAECLTRDVGKNLSDSARWCVLAFDWSGEIGEYERNAVANEFCYNPFDFQWRPVAQARFAIDLSRVFESQTGTAATNEAVYGWRGGKVTFKQSAIARQIGRPDNMEELIRRLLRAVRGLSSYDFDVEMPVVHSLPLAQLHLRLCSRPCTIRAAYVPGEGLYIDEMMRPLSNQYDQSILFHELVHHVQVAASSHPAKDECQRWRAREFEAYALQNQFLFALGSPSRAMWPGNLCARADTKPVASETQFGL